MRRFSILLGLSVWAWMPACSGRHAPATPPAPVPRLVSIQVEVYDPATNYVWQNMSVRIVEGSMEWSGLTTANPDPTWSFTDSYGTVTFDSRDLAGAEIGFREGPYGQAWLEPELDADEATVVLEINAPGQPSVFVDVDVSWDEPDVFVSVPY